MDSIIRILSKEMEKPKSYGIYHFIWLFVIAIMIFIIYKKKNKYSEKQLNKVLLFYGVIAFILELIKQIIWSYDLDTKTWEYIWYIAPFQLCTTPIYASLIAAFTKNQKLKKSLLTYIAYITILGSLATMIYPESCFVKTIEVNIHTMFLHCGSFILSIYIIVNYLQKANYKPAIYSFLIFEAIALLLDLVIYNLNILGNHTFNMFYISPYFQSSLPVFSTLQDKLPYILFLLSYNLIIILGGFIIYKISNINIKKIKQKSKNHI